VPVDVQSVVQVATPDPLTDCDPQPEIVVPLLLKLTVPTGSAPKPETVAVRVVEVPTVVEEEPEESVVLEEPRPTVSEVVPVEPL
jgi:hypothetical protein